MRKQYWECFTKWFISINLELHLRCNFDCYGTNYDMANWQCHIQTASVVYALPLSSQRIHIRTELCLISADKMKLASQRSAQKAEPAYNAIPWKWNNFIFPTGLPATTALSYTVAPELEGFSNTAHHWAQIEANYSFFRLPQAHSQTGLH